MKSDLRSGPGAASEEGAAGGGAGAHCASHRPWSRADGIALVVLVALSAMGLVWLVHPWYTPYLDASIYISTARAMLSGEGYAHLGQPCNVRPPGFSFLLVPVIAAFGTSFRAMNLYVAAFGAGSLTLLFCWARPRLGAVLSLLACIAVGTNPVFLRHCTQVLSDVPGLFFTLAVLLFARHCERRHSLPKELLLGALVGVSAYVRMINIMLLPAILLSRFFSQLRTSGPRPSWARFLLRQCAPIAIATLLVFAPWPIRNLRNPIELPLDQQANHSYSTALFHVDQGDPASPLIGADDWIQRLRQRGGQITADLSTRLDSSKASTPRLVAGLLVLAVYLFWLFATPSVAGFFILLCLAITGSYFAYVVRLLLPVFALLVPALGEALHRILRRRMPSPWATGVVATLLVTMTAFDFSPRHYWSWTEGKHEHMAAIAEALEESLPHDARLATGRGFVLGVQMNRDVYSLHWADRMGPGIEGVEAVIDRRGINTVVLDPKDVVDRRFLGPLTAKYGKGEVLGGVRVFRVRSE